MVQSQIIVGHARRRTFTEEEKRAIVAGAFLPGQSLRDFAFRNDIPCSSIYKWRKELETATAPEATTGICPANANVGGFAEVVTISDRSSAEQPVERTLGHVMEVVIGGSHVRIPASIPPALAAAVIEALVKT